MGLPELTIEQAHKFLTFAAEVGKEWCGLPMPFAHLPLDIDPRYPYAAAFNRSMENGTMVCSNEDVREDVAFINSWRSLAGRGYITIWREGSRYIGARTNVAQCQMLLQTLDASRAWDMDAEIKATEKLHDLVTGTQFGHYFMTGTFLETSKRSKVAYLFRRLRPTVAISTRGESATILCTLCGHGIGYYRESWAGALCPTDDVIAALLLMRGDEHYFWRTSEQHFVLDTESGL